MIKLVVFDMDGTIVHSMPTLRTIGASVMLRMLCGNRPASLSETTLAYEKYDTTVGKPFREQLEINFPCDLRNDTMAIWYKRAHEARADGFPLAFDLRDIIYVGAPYHTALISSTSCEIIRQMSQVTALPLDTIFGWQPGRSKIVQLQDAIKMAHVTTAETLYVGDSPSDKLVADAVGTHFQRVTVQNVVNVVKRTVAYHAD